MLNYGAVSYSYLRCHLSKAVRNVTTCFKCRETKQLIMPSPLKFIALRYAPFDTEEIHMALWRCCNTTARSRKYQGSHGLSRSTFVNLFRFRFVATIYRRIFLKNCVFKNKQTNELLWCAFSQEIGSISSHVWWGFQHRRPVSESYK